MYEPNPQVRSPPAQGTAPPKLLRDEAVLRPSKVDGSQPQSQRPMAPDLVSAMGLSCRAGRRSRRSIGGLTRIARCQEVTAARCDAEDVPQGPGQLFDQAPHLVKGRVLVIESF